MKFRATFLILTLPVFLASCMGSKSSPRYSYAPVDPQPTAQKKAIAPPSEKEPNQWDKPEFTYYISDTPTSARPENEVAARYENNVIQTTVIPGTDRVRNTINTHPGYQYASNDPYAEEQSTELMIEEKLFKLVQDAYQRRDQVKFPELYKFFFESFPNTKRKAELIEFHNKFFYKENRQLKDLNDALVEITYPKAKTLKELSDYFRELKKNQIHSIQVNVVGLIDTPIYLFGNTDKSIGYYFPTHNDDMTADDILSKIVMTAHANNIKLYASFPLRHHPWIGTNELYIMDESWNALENKTSPNSKLDLFNPDSRLLLENLIDALLTSDIDGIIFKDDFTYDLYEGFSDTAIKRYQEATGQSVALSELFIPINSDSGQGYEVVTTQGFNDLARWRAGEISQLLWDLTARIRNERPNFKVGLEMTPEMFLDNGLSMKWYSTGLQYLENQKMDFYILKWRKYNSEAETDVESYKTAVAMLNDTIRKETQIYSKIPLSPATQNVIRLNERIKEQRLIQEDYEGIKTAIGPVNRLKNQDFIRPIQSEMKN